MRWRSGLVIAAALLLACNQAGVAFGATGSLSRAKSFPFAAIAQDAVVVKKLLAVQNLIVADGARVIPGARSLAAGIERRDGVMQSLSAGVINDAARVARAEQRARRAAHGTALGDESLMSTDLSHLISNETTDVRTNLAIMEKVEAVSIADMFQMQMRMNHLSQLSEMSTSVASALSSSIASMERNVKS